MGKARDYIPALSQGHKIYPQDLAGMVGQPYVGNVFYVDATNGSNANDGRSKDTALKTLTKAYDLAADNNHDVIVIAPGEVGSGSGTSELATLTWAKDQIHVVGACAPVRLSHRARVLWTVDSVDPCLLLTGQGNTFSNVQLGTFQASNDVLVEVQGDRNVFLNTHLAGIGHDTAGDDATARSLYLNGAEENRFVGGTIGLDTVARSTSNAEIELANAATRNSFEDVHIISYADNAGHLWVKAAASGGIDRYVNFQDCLFYNGIGSAGTAMTVGMDLHASVGGLVLLTGTTMAVGATDWADDFTNLYVGGVVPTQATSGLMVVGA